MNCSEPVVVPARYHSKIVCKFIAYKLMVYVDFRELLKKKTGTLCQHMHFILLPLTTYSLSPHLCIGGASIPCRGTSMFPLRKDKLAVRRPAQTTDGIICKKKEKLKKKKRGDLGGLIQLIIPLSQQKIANNASLSFNPPSNILPLLLFNFPFPSIAQNGRQHVPK